MYLVYELFYKYQLEEEMINSGLHSFSTTSVFQDLPEMIKSVSGVISVSCQTLTFATCDNRNMISIFIITISRDISNWLIMSSYNRLSINNDNSNI